MTEVKFDHLLPQKLLEKGISLEPILGIPRFIWNTVYALEIITICLENSLVILGGDVLVISSNSEKPIQYTGDNWYYQPNESRGGLEQSIASCVYAKEKVIFFSNSYGKETTMFNLVIRVGGA